MTNKREHFNRRFIKFSGAAPGIYFLQIIFNKPNKAFLNHLKIRSFFSIPGGNIQDNFKCQLYLRILYQKVTIWLYIFSVLRFSQHLILYFYWEKRNALQIPVKYLFHNSFFSPLSWYTDNSWILLPVYSIPFSSDW